MNGILENIHIMKKEIRKNKRCEIQKTNSKR